MTEPDAILVLVRPTWALDKDVNECTQCQSLFSAFNRRHHCRQCGLIFCAKCCKAKVNLPQLAYHEKERVCDGCFEIAEIVGAMLSDDPATQGKATQALCEFAPKDNNLAKVVSLGGLDTLLHICQQSKNDDVLLEGSKALESLAHFDRLQNTMVARGALSILFNMCSSSSINIAMNAVKALFLFAKAPDSCELLANEKGLHTLLDVAHKDRPNTDPAQVALLQGTAARVLSYVCVPEKNQLKVIDDRKNALDYLIGLLNSKNDDVRKYSAKSLAFLSLRNDKSKAQLLRNNSIPSIVHVMQTDKVRETLSHIACAIANLATNGESQAQLISNPDLLGAFCHLAEGASDRSDILRHVVRGVANFTLYEPNKEKLVQTALPLLIKLGHSNVPETQRHIVRAIDNLLANAPDSIVDAMRDAGAVQVLQAFVSTQTSADSADMVKRANLALEQFATAAAAATTSAPVSVAVTSSHMVEQTQAPVTESTLVPNESAIAKVAADQEPHSEKNSGTDEDASATLGVDGKEEYAADANNGGNGDTDANRGENGINDDNGNDEQGLAEETDETLN